MHARLQLSRERWAAEIEMKVVALSILLALVALGVGFFLLLGHVHRNSPHRHLFTQEHYLEFVSRIREMKDRLSACDHSSAGPCEAEFTTSVGLYLLYSIEPIANNFLHHYSISHREGRIAFAAGGLFAFLLADRLGIGDRDLEIAYSDRGVTHVALLLDETSQQQLFKHEVSVPEASELVTIRKAAAAKRDAAISEAMKANEEDILRRVLNTR